RLPAEEVRLRGRALDPGDGDRAHDGGGPAPVAHSVSRKLRHLRLAPDRGGPPRHGGGPLGPAADAEAMNGNIRKGAVRNTGGRAGPPGDSADSYIPIGEVPTQPCSETSTVTPSGPTYFTSTLAARLVPCPTPSAWLMSSRGTEPAAFSRSAISSRLSTWKPKWWMPLQPVPRSTPATASFLKLR